MPLRPVPRVGLRAALLAAAVVAIAISAQPWSVKLPAMLFWASVIGSYRFARLDGERIETGIVVCFVPIKPRSIRLDRIAQLRVDVEQAAGLAWGCVIGPWNLLWAWFLDWMFPWFGGRYRLWIVSPKGTRVLVWQGNSDELFRENVDRLETATGLVLERTEIRP